LALLSTNLCKQKNKKNQVLFFFTFSILLFFFNALIHINTLFYLTSLILIFFIKNKDFKSSDRILILCISLFLFAYTLIAVFPYLDILNDNFYFKVFLFISVYFIYFLFINKKNALFIISLIFLIFFKDYINKNSLILTSKTDYQTLLNILIFAKIFFLTKVFLDKTQIKFELPNFFHLSICLHLLNYFLSGIKKLIFESPFFWLTENNLFNLIEYGLVGGFNPIPNFFLNPYIVKYINFYETELNILLASSVIIPQLLTPIAFFKKRTIPFFLIYFEIQHLMIYAISGIFFYKWIFLNILFLYIYINFKKKKNLIFQPIHKVFFLPLYLVIFFLNFEIVRLGWLDSYAYYKDYIQVELKNKKIVNLPSSFFLASSLPYTQSRFFSDLKTNNPGAFGAVQSPQFFRETKNCNIQIVEEDKFYHSPTYNMLKKSYQFNLKIVKQNSYLKDNIYNVFYYPHHVFQNPQNYNHLKNISLNEFDKAYFVREIYCNNSYNNHRLVKSYKIFLGYHD
jgi:hypothetical protein